METWSAFPSGAPLLAASGAAFTAVVAGQMANAFACRSAVVSPRHLGWFSNRYLVAAVLCELLMLAGFLYLPFLSNLLEQAPPNAVGYIVGSACDSSSPRRRRDTQTAARTIEFAPLNHSCGPP